MKLLGNFELHSDIKYLVCLILKLWHKHTLCNVAKNLKSLIVNIAYSHWFGPFYKEKKKK